jgi:hypothetical protein
MPPARKAPPSPAEPEQLPPEEEGASADSSTGSSAATDFIADPGPEFEPSQADQDASERDGDRALSIGPGGETGIQVEWDPSVVKGLLEAQGSALHSVAGKADQDWLYTKDELAAISGPLTRILNRYDATRVAAGTGDELALLLGLTGHTMRSLQERKAVLDAAKAAAEEAEHQATQFGAVPTQPTQETPIQ